MPVALENLSFTGRGLNRPECVLAAANRVLLAADIGDGPNSGRGGGVTRIAPDGTQERILAKDAALELFPNGIGLRADGSMLVTHLGAAASS